VGFLECANPCANPGGIEGKRVSLPLRPWTVLLSLRTSYRPRRWYPNHPLQYCFEERRAPILGVMDRPSERRVRLPKDAGPDRRASVRFPLTLDVRYSVSPTLADGILDRLVHNAHRIEMKGDSMRKNRNSPRSG
jgi:IstB-like ATP binding protein